MVPLTDAQVKSQMYTQDSLTFWEKRKVKKLCKLVDKHILGAVDLGKSETDFVITCEDVFPDEKITTAAEIEPYSRDIFLVRNVVEKYRQEGYVVEGTITAERHTYGRYVPLCKIHIDWTDRELLDSIAKYTKK